MTPLFKRKVVTRSQVLAQTNEHPIDQTLPAWNPNEGLGKGFNILKMVEEHAPARIKEIEHELDALNKKHAELSYEKLQLSNLIGALKK
jgi:hypothetical protein